MNYFTRNPWSQLGQSVAVGESELEQSLLLTLLWLFCHLCHLPAFKLDLLRAWGCLSMSTIKIVGWKWFIYIIPLLVWGLITPALALRAWLSVQGTRITQCLGQTFGLFAFSPTLLLAPGRAGTKRGWVALVLASRSDQQQKQMAASSFRLSNPTS